MSNVVSGPWKPGQSGNPRGLPKLSDYQKKALASARRWSYEAVLECRKVYKDPRVEPKDRLKALQLFLDLGLPKWAREMADGPDQRVAELVAKLDEMGSDDAAAALEALAAELRTG